MNILICDPDGNEAQKLERQIKALDNEREKCLKTYCFTDFGDVLKSKVRFDIAVIRADADKDDCEGFSKILRNRFPYLKVIYIADNYDRLDECIDMGAIRYLVRPFSEARFNFGIAEAVRRLEAETVTLNLKSAFETTRIIISSIIYIEIVNRKTKVVTTDGMYMSKYSLSYWRERLNDFGFVSAHISFLVNMNYITRYRRNKLIVLDNKYEVPISRSRGSEFHKIYSEFTSVTDRTTAGD